jgi:hypothetical protein
VPSRPPTMPPNRPHRVTLPAATDLLLSGPEEEAPYDYQYVDPEAEEGPVDPRRMRLAECQYIIQALQREVATLQGNPDAENTGTNLLPPPVIGGPIPTPAPITAPSPLHSTQPTIPHIESVIPSACTGLSSQWMRQLFVETTPPQFVPPPHPTHPPPPTFSMVHTTNPPCGTR